MMGNVDAASGFDDPSLVDVDIMDEGCGSTRGNSTGTSFGTGFIDAD